MSQALALAVALVAGYLLGSVPFGLVLTRLAGHGDIRRIGSGNIGATNVLRTGNKPLAGVVLMGDDRPANRAAIEHFGDAPVLGRIPPLDPLTPAAVADAASRLDMPEQVR